MMDFRAKLSPNLGGKFEQWEISSNGGASHTSAKTSRTRTRWKLEPMKVLRSKAPPATIERKPSFMSSLTVPAPKSHYGSQRSCSTEAMRKTKYILAYADQESTENAKRIISRRSANGEYVDHFPLIWLNERNSRSLAKTFSLLGEEDSGLVSQLSVEKK